MAGDRAVGLVAPVPQLDVVGVWTRPAELAARLWAFRDLCLTLARKDFFVKYRRAVFGVLWAVALPAVQAVVLSVVLSRVARISVAHYPLFIFSGTVAWTYFSSSLSSGSTSIVDNSAMSSKIYFPRLVLPIATCLSNLFTLAISIVIVVVAVPIFGVAIAPRLLLLIPGTALLFLVVVSMTLVVSALHVYFRDATYVVQAMLLVWFYVTPVFYPLTLLHGAVRAVVEANPITGVVGIFHAAAIGGPVADPLGWLVSAAWALVLLTIALVLHCRFDRSFADLL